VPTLPNSRLGDWLRGRPPLEEMRYRAETQPTLINHLVLAQRLMEQHGHDEALPHLLAAHKMEPEHGLVLYTLARCHLEQGHPEQAVPVLEGLVAREPRWANYSAWRLLAKARSEAGDAAGAADACRQLTRLAPTMERTCLLAEHLLAAGQATEAREVLSRALRDHDFAPRSARGRDARWARQARRLLKQADNGQAPS
jgi:predicted Zn-dependent protease